MNMKAWLVIGLEVILLVVSVYFFAPLGILYIDTMPSGALARIDGDPAGRTPIYLTFITPRKYEIELEKEGYAKNTHSIEVGRIVRTIEKIPLEKVYSFEIRSDPPGAYVIFEGKKVLDQKTPTTIKDLKAGKYIVKLDLEDYPSISQVLDTESTPSSLMMSFKEGITVVFNSNPQGAKITLDGRELGTTPCKVQGLRAKGYLANLNLEGYEPINQQIDLGVTGNQVTFTMDKLHPVAILSSPPGLQVKQDGVVIGKTPLIAYIIEGSYQISIADITHKINVPKDVKTFFEADGNAKFQLVDKSRTVFDVEGKMTSLTSKAPTGIYTLATPIEHGRLLHEEIEFYGKPLKTSWYKFTEDGKTKIKSFGGSRTIGILKNNDMIPFGEGEVTLNLERIDERIGKQDSYQIQVGQGNWSTVFTITRAEIMYGIELKVEVVR
jgi:hypothetical protein